MKNAKAKFSVTVSGVTSELRKLKDVKAFVEQSVRAGAHPNDITIQENFYSRLNSELIKAEPVSSLALLF